MFNNTFSNNTATILNAGGAIYANQGNINLANNIFLLSSDGNDCDVNAGTITSFEGNITDTDGTSCNFLGSDDVSTADSIVDNLADNGGPTQTMLPIAGEGALEGGVSQYCTSRDARGKTRSFDYDGDSDAQCDRGAVELTF